MIAISNSDAKTLHRVLSYVQGMAGADNKGKNIKRQAVLLQKRIGVKMSKKWQSKG